MKLGRFFFNMSKYETDIYFLTVDPTPRAAKPEKDDKTIGIIHNNLNIATGLTINEFSTYVAQPYGYTWIGALFENNEVNNRNWRGQRIFALDFDKGLLTVDQVFERFGQYQIIPQVWYSTLSDSSLLAKFRVVIFLDEPVIHEPLRQYIADGLLSLFPEADQTCRNAGRFYFGGQESHITNTTPISLQKLKDVISIDIITQDGGRTRKLDPLLQDTRSSTGTGRKGMFIYSNYISNHLEPEQKIKSTTIDGGQVLDMTKAKQKVRILKEFLEGRWLNHNELFGLATNMIYIKGGSLLMNKTMVDHNNAGKTSYTPNNFKILTYLKKVQYPPIPLHSFSPFEEDKELYDIISATKDIHGEIIQLEPITRIELSEAEELLRSKFEEVYQNGEIGKIYLLCLPTAIGKTELILSAKNATIAVPTSILKNEIGARMKVDFIKTPDPVIFESKYLNRKVDYYNKVGLQKKAVAVLYDVINPKNIRLFSVEDIAKAERYLSELDASKYSNTTILTTHTRAMHTPFIHDTLIFDEDPQNEAIDIKQILLSDLQKLDNQNLHAADSELGPIIAYLRNCAPAEIIHTPAFSIDPDLLIDQLSRAQAESNIVEFFVSSYFVRDDRNGDCFHYVIKRELPKDKRVIILSATIPIYIYQKLYGDRLIVVDIKDVKQQGTIIQYTSRSCSRNGLGRYVDEISKKVGERPVITFKSFAHKFQNPVKGIHFGNCSGYDTLKGQDIVVAGTPHRNNVEYLLTAKVLGIEFNTMDTTMSHQMIDYSGFRFKFNCFDNIELRNIQLALIESELIQAVGRARTLRTDAKVEVYSNFPLRMTDRFVY